MNPVIQTEGLTRRFRGCEAVHGLDLTMEAGRFLAFLGRNGAGKTTTIRLLAGLLQPSEGHSSLLGIDSQKLGETGWQQIGYVAEDQQLYDWLTAKELIEFTKTFYPNWDDAFCRELIDLLHMPMSRKLKHCSRGEKMKIKLLLALAFRPKLLILDEPFSGLDPLVKEELIGCLLELTEQDSWSVFFSSHDVYEVEKLADEVAIIEEGRLVLHEPLDELQSRFRQVRILGDFQPDASEHLINFKRSEGVVSFVHTAFTSSVEEELRDRQNAEIVSMSLREIFVASARNQLYEKAQS